MSRLETATISSLKESISRLAGLGRKDGHMTVRKRRSNKEKRKRTRTRVSSSPKLAIIDSNIAAYGSRLDQSPSRLPPTIVSKKEMVLSMLRGQGASVASIMAATGWQEHSVRGFFAAVVKKKLGLNLVSEKVDGLRLYRINSPDPAS
jgi:hypothetical protein